jgi:hypothetical protein
MFLFTIVLVGSLVGYPLERPDSTRGFNVQQNAFYGLGNSSLTALAQRSGKTSTIAAVVTKLETDIGKEDWSSAKSDFKEADKALRMLKDNYGPKGSAKI